MTDLRFSGTEADYQTMVAAADAGVPTIAAPNLSRPLIMGNVLEHGRAKPHGRLPFELPSSMEEVKAQLPDVPNDTANPLFEYGFGLSYGAKG